MTLGLGLRQGPLVGRERDGRVVAGMVASSALSTLVGPGGVGKTALAVSLARDLAPSFPGGARVAWLGGIRSPSLVTAEVARAVGLPRSRGLSYARALVAWFQTRSALLVVDNCEHVIDSVAALVDVLISQAPQLRILATSREPLSVRGEVTHRLAPLAVPGPDAAAEELATSPGVRLFTERARARVPDFDATAEGARVVGEICRRLDGLPLAIELAAARVAALELPDMAARLDDVFGLLPLAGRGGEGRQRTLRSTVEWSYGLLDHEERVLFRRLSVFSGGFDLAAVEAVCGSRGQTPATVADLTARLVEKSLLIKNEAGGGYRMLEPIRQFAVQLLTDTGEADEIRNRHARWFLDVGLRVGTGLLAGHERTWLDQLSRAEGDLRIALDRLIDGLDPVGGLTLAINLSMFWWTRGAHREGTHWIQACLAAARDAPAELHAAGWFHLGFLLAHDTDDWAGAAELLDRGIATASRSADPPAILGYLLCLRGECAVFAGDARQGLELAARGLSIIRRFPDPWGAGFGLWNVGFAHLAAEDLDRAEACFQEMVDIERRAGIGLVQMVGCNSLGELAEQRGDLGRARAMYEEALRLRRELGAARLGYVHGSLPRSMLAVARVAAEQGDSSAAVRLLEQGLPLAEQMQDTETITRTRELLHRVGGPRWGTPARYQREGALWRVEFAGRSVHVPDSKGMRHLRELLARPGMPLPALSLSTAGHAAPLPTNDTGPVLDEQARRAYRERLRQLEEDLTEAEEEHDSYRAERARYEQDALIHQLGQATGLHGRRRRTGSPVERARLNVTRTLRHAVQTMAVAHPELGAHLDRSLQTGTLCCYQPTEAVTWHL